MVGDLDARAGQLAAGLVVLLAGSDDAHAGHGEGALVKAVDVGVAESDEGDAHVVQGGLRREGN